MNKLEVGMYVRTKSGLIAKYTGFEKDENDDEYNKYNFDGKIFWYYEYYNEYVYEEDFEYWFENSVVKTSHNIIDLIEVGDYVNGNKVTETMIKMRDEQGIFGLPDVCNMYIEEIKVKSIVTKDQFSSMEYSLVE